MRLSALSMLAAALLAAHPARAQQPPPDGWVVLSLDDYRALRTRAFPTPPDPPAPPVDAALTRVEYDVRVAADSVSGEARLTVDVLKEGWVSVRIPDGLLVRAARLDGRPTTLVDGAPPRVLMSKPGRSVLTLEIVVPLSASAGSESITLPPAGSAMSTATFTVPRDGVDLTVTGGFRGEQTANAGESRWMVYGTPSKPLTLSWKRKVDDRRATLPLRLRARLTELVVLGEESSSVSAGVRVEVVQGAAREVSLTTPEGIAINQVTGATVADWRHEGGALTVTFLEPVATDTAFVVHGEVRAPRDGSVAIPLVRLPAAERETGGIAVDVAGSGEIAGRQPRGLDAADASDLGDVVAGRESPSMAAFRFRPAAGTAPRSLTVELSRYTPDAVLVANVEEARYEALVGEDGKTLVRVRYAVRNNQRSFLAVTLPASSTLWSAALNGRPVRPGLSPNGSLLLPLQKGRTGEEAPVFAVELVYLQQAQAWTERGTARLELPAIDLPVSRTGLRVRHSPRFGVAMKPGPFRMDSDAGPWTPVLDAAQAIDANESGEERPKQITTAITLLDRARKDSARSLTGIVPISVALPQFGASVFFATELTPESRTTTLELEYRRR